MKHDESESRATDAAAGQSADETGPEAVPDVAAVFRSPALGEADGSLIRVEPPRPKGVAKKGAPIRAARGSFAAILAVALAEDARAHGFDRIADWFEMFAAGVEVRRFGDRNGPRSQTQRADSPFGEPATRLKRLH